MALTGRCIKLRYTPPPGTQGSSYIHPCVVRRCSFNGREEEEVVKYCTAWKGLPAEFTGFKYFFFFI